MGCTILFGPRQKLGSTLVDDCILILERQKHVELSGFMNASAVLHRMAFFSHNYNALFLFPSRSPHTLHNFILPTNYTKFFMHCVHYINPVKFVLISSQRINGTPSLTAQGMAFSEGCEDCNINIAV